MDTYNFLLEQDGSEFRIMGVAAKSLDDAKKLLEKGIGPGFTIIKVWYDKN